MNFIKFCQEIKLSIQSKVSNNYKVNLIKVDKLNGVTLQSIAIQKNNETITPNIYLEEYYNQYLEGRSIESLTNDIISYYFQEDELIDVSIPSFMNFYEIKDRLFFKLINYEKNRELLERMPHVKWLDLAIIFAVLVKKNAEGISSFNVKDELIEYWNVDTDTIYDYAIKNTPILFGTNVRLMDDIITELIIKDFSENDTFNTMLNSILPKQNNADGFHEMYVASNTPGINGAVWLLYKDEMQILSNKLNSSLYILPSSIHEVIIVPAEDKLQIEQLLNMVKEVNETQVPIQEVLSDNVYYFNRETDEIYPLAK